MESADAAHERIELNGREVRIDELACLAQTNYGHFTTMQVRERRACGFELHLQRLAHATRALFNSELDLEQIRDWIRGIIDENPVSLRVTVFSKAFDQARPEHPAPVDVLITTRAPNRRRTLPLRLQSTQFERALPDIKHIGMLDLLHLRRQARIAGFDDVLLTARDGQISEGSTWNIGFWDGRRISWPTAPALPGITRRLLDSGLRANALETIDRPIHLDQLGEFRSAFILNSGSVGPMIESIDSRRFDVDEALMRSLTEAYDSQWREPI